MESPFLYTVALSVLLCAHVCASSTVNTLRILAMSNDERKIEGIHAELKSSASTFGKKNGIDIEFEVEKWDTILDVILKDLNSTSPRYDAYTTLLADVPTLAEQGFLATFDNELSKADWHDVFPSVRKECEYDGKTYALPLDADFLFVIYRKDYFDEYNISAPTTWKEYADISKKLNGKDLNNDLKPDFGNCLLVDNTYRSSSLFFGVGAPFMQYDGETFGLPFDTTTMEPRFQSKSFKDAISLYKTLYETSQAQERDMGIFDIPEVFSKGRCALLLAYPGTMKFIYKSIRPSPDANATNARRVYLGLSVPPGVEGIHFDPKTPPCNLHPEKCPHATQQFHGGLVNEAPFLSTGGWSVLVRKNKLQPEREENAKKFALFVSGKEESAKLVCKPGVLDPFRYSHILSRKDWIEEWTSTEELHNVLDDLYPLTLSSLSHPNVARDLSIPESDKLYGAMNSLMLEYFKDKKGLEETINDLQNNWTRQISAHPLGKERLLTIYRKSLSLEPLPLPSSKSLNTFDHTIYLIVIVSLGSIVVFAILLCYHQRHKQRQQLRELQRRSLTEYEMLEAQKKFFARNLIIAIVTAVSDLVGSVMDWLVLVDMIIEEPHFKFSPLVIAYCLKTGSGSAVTLFATGRRLPRIRSLNEERKGLLNMEKHKISTSVIDQFKQFESPMSRILRYDVELKTFRVSLIVYLMRDVPSLVIYSLFISEAEGNAYHSTTALLAFSFALVKVGLMLQNFLHAKESASTRARLTDEIKRLQGTELEDVKGPPK